ncbi:MAG: hypothetical protein PHX61_03030 [Alphaproteobacteria bacterium]|nr:hypothetical protein [Alphaproteobacteria bacterium]
MKSIRKAFFAAALSSLAVAQSFAHSFYDDRVDAPADQAPYNGIKPLLLEEGNCTLQFGASRQVATTAGHCVEMIMLGVESRAIVKDNKGQTYRVTKIYIPKQFDPRDTSSKMYFDKAILVLDRPMNGAVNQFRMQAVEPEDFLGKGNRQQSIEVEQAGYPYTMNGTLSANPDCKLYEPHYNKEKTAFVLTHNCKIAPGDSGSAAWEIGTNIQRAIVTSLNFAVPLTKSFIDTYNHIAENVAQDEREKSVAPENSGMMKVGMRSNVPPKTSSTRRNIEIYRVDM